MNSELFIYNTLSRQKELFKPLNPGRVGMYVCGPTVYGDAHLGHARPAITFDLLFRYLQHIGYKVRYVRNITDVGHLEHDADEGEDKIAKKARLEQLEPMEVAQYYTNRFHQAMDALGCLPPSIEPHATGHIIEQQALVQQILDNGYAYVVHVVNAATAAGTAVVLQGDAGAEVLEVILAPGDVGQDAVRHHVVGNTQLHVVGTALGYEGLPGR